MYFKTIIDAIFHNLFMMKILDIFGTLLGMNVESPSFFQVVLLFANVKKENGQRCQHDPKFSPSKYLAQFLRYRTSILRGEYMVMV